MEALRRGPSEINQSCFANHYLKFLQVGFAWKGIKIDPSIKWRSGKQYKPFGGPIGEKDGVLMHF